MEIKAGIKEEGITLKEYFSRQGFSARLITRLKNKERGILVNGEKKTVRYTLSQGDVLTLAVEDDAPSENIPMASQPAEVLYEDQYIVAVKKGANTPTHPSRNHTDDTLASAVAKLYEGENFVFRPLTRLDRDTSGAVLVAKDPISAAKLSDMLKKRLIEKRYLAVCQGFFEKDSGVIDFNIRRARPFGMERECVERAAGDCENSLVGIEAVTEYRVIARGRSTSLVEFSPLTGRTHQIRVHSLAVGHPIVGDTLYSTPSPLISRQALHAYSLTFTHPYTHERISVVCPLPEDFRHLLESELYDTQI